jgi:hypothetical protein
VPDDVTRPITIASDTVRNIDIPSVQLAGRVLENGGAPIVGASVFARGVESATASTISEKQTDDFGGFGLTGIETGEIQLTVYRPGYALYREKLTYSTPIKDKSITLRSDRGVEVRVHVSTSGGERMRRFSVVENFMDQAPPILLRIPVDREGIAFLPSGLTGSRLIIFGAGGKEPTVISEWDGSSLELTF